MPPEPTKLISLLAIQGGGVRGIMAATSLDQWEENHKSLSCNQYDMVAGTSIGCIIAAAVALGVPLFNVKRMFYDSGPKIFANSFIRDLGRLGHAAKYIPDGLRGALESIFTGGRLDTCQTRFFATAVDMASGRPIWFQSYGETKFTDDEIIIGPDSKLSMVDVCLASAAAQSYFPAHVITVNGVTMVCWDGGSTGCNAPDMRLLTEARAIWPGRVGDMSMVSLGAGATDWAYDGQDMVNPSIMTVVGATLDIVYALSESDQVYNAAQWLDGRHQRINPYIPDVAIDDATFESLSLLEHSSGAII